MSLVNMPREMLEIILNKLPIKRLIKIKNTSYNVNNVAKHIIISRLKKSGYHNLTNWKENINDLVNLSWYIEDDLEIDILKIIKAFRGGKFSLVDFILNNLEYPIEYYINYIRTNGNDNVMSILACIDDNMSDIVDCDENAVYGLTAYVRQYQKGLITGTILDNYRYYPAFYRMSTRILYNFDFDYISIQYAIALLESDSNFFRIEERNYRD